MTSTRHWLRALGLALTCLGLAGCAGLGAGAFGGLLTLVGALLLVACGQPVQGATADATVGSETVQDVTGGGTGTDGVAPTDVGSCDGQWESCCQSGTMTKCCCPKGAACNYGWYTDCGNGTCKEGPEASCTGLEDAVGGDTSPPTDTPSDVPAPPTDVLPTDLPLSDTTTCDGTWESCCQSGQVTLCCCPSGLECNYGWYTPCAGNTCVEGPGAGCPGEFDVQQPSDLTSWPEFTVDPDASNPSDLVLTFDDGCSGSWDTCCNSGQVTLCCCPAGAACNFGWFDQCSDGSCAFPGGCPVIEDAGSAPDTSEPVELIPFDAGKPTPDAGCDGTWESCCVDGHVSQCCCPNGAACNYGWYTDCGNGTCVMGPQTCPTPS